MNQSQADSGIPRRFNRRGKCSSVRHVGYGVKLVDYDALREALLWTLEQALGEDFTPAVRETWAVCYDELAVLAAIQPRGMAAIRHPAAINI